MGDHDERAAAERVAAAGSLEDIEALFARAQREPGSTPDGQAALVQLLARRLVEHDFGEPERQADLVERYVLSVLELPDSPAPDREAALFDLLGDPAQRREGEPDAQWSSRRRRVATALLAALERVAGDGEDEDEEEVAQANLEPPPETGLPSGVAPEEIDDPELRARYEADLDRNRALAERAVERHRRRLSADALRVRAERHVVAAYSQPPPAQAELDALLERHIGDPAERERIRGQAGA